MKRIAEFNKGCARTLTVAMLALAMALSGVGPAWADRGGDRGRQEGRYEERHRGKSEHRFDQRHREKEKVKVVRELPRGHRKVVVNKTTYYVHDHRFYTRASGGYLSVRPPVGAVVATLPLGSVTLNIGGVFYSRYDDVYYRPVGRGYQVVNAPYYAPAAPGGSVVKVWASTLNVRSGPGRHFGVIGQAWQGQRLIVSAQAPGWYLVRLPNGLSGWVMSEYTHAFGAG